MKGSTQRGRGGGGAGGGGGGQRGSPQTPLPVPLNKDLLCPNSIPHTQARQSYKCAIQNTHRNTNYVNSHAKRASHKLHCPPPSHQRSPPTDTTNTAHKLLGTSLSLHKMHHITESQKLFHHKLSRCQATGTRQRNSSIETNTGISKIS